VVQLVLLESKDIPVLSALLESRVFKEFLVLQQIWVILVQLDLLAVLVIPESRDLLEQELQEPLDQLDLQEPKDLLDQLEIQELKDLRELELQELPVLQESKE
jgi:hypothetical protein